jgi:glycine oxidase
MHEVVIAGGGVIGLSVARELALRGHSVLVLDRGNPRDATSWAAAGMLAPQSEAEAPNPFFEFCLASARLYRDWTHHLHEESGIDPEFAASGLIFVASTEDAFCRLRRAVEWQKAAGFTADLLAPQDVQRMEARVTLDLVGAVLLEKECNVTPRLLLESLKGSCAAKGVEIRSGVRVLEVTEASGRVTGVKTSTERIEAEHVVIASGVYSPEIEGLYPVIPLVPRKGQILSLATPAPMFQRMIRWEHAYLV